MSIVTEICKILKGSANLSDFDKGIMELMSQLMIESVGETLERLDKEIIQPYLESGWEIDRIEERQVTFLFGTVRFSRRRLRQKGEESILPLDQALGLKSRERYSPSFHERLSLLATGMTYRQASRSLELLTGIEISHQGIHNMVQRVGEKVMTSQLEEDDTKLRRPDYLFIEGDGLWINSQTKGKNIELKRDYLHEGVRRVGKRGELINPVYFGCFGTSKDLFTQMKDYIQMHYDLRDTIIIANSDGGSGYEADKFEGLLGRYKSFTYCLDSYHVMKYLTVNLGFDKELLQAVRSSVKAYDRERLEVMLDTAESLLEDDKQVKKLLIVRSYLNRNWEYIKHLCLRELGIRDGVGTCEGGHRFYSYRIKKQGRNWSNSGVSHLVAIMTSMKNGTFEALYRSRTPYQPFNDEITISMRRVLKKLSHEPHRIPQASIALNGATSSPIGQLKKWI
ncbi:DDE transposase [Streptococcus equi subsp. zooepidemicus SzAM60]|uniref:ISLre2 family transposase n=1 Tax=Streptococcus equi TaxID=1336 RepID=UPI0005B8BA9F|nr:ISLre2 family transposase [Streptococcus equi]KIS13518.1 DDE transposase [Streptococcus equi subsp. zooepidemicus SzAM60]HEL1178806.1 ISLre2 family transposase [Streptococcus equi subsp. zooepidemicus]